MSAKSGNIDSGDVLAKTRDFPSDSLGKILLENVMIFPPFFFLFEDTGLKLLALLKLQMITQMISTRF